MPTPAAYIPDEVIYSEKLECGKFSSPKDMFITDDGTIYVADTGNNRIVVLHPDMSLKKVIYTLYLKYAKLTKKFIK